MSCIAVNEEIIAVTKGPLIDCYDRENKKVISISNNHIQQDDNICDIVISFDNKYLAVITSITKKLIIFSLPTIKVVQLFDIPKSATKIRFTQDNSKILVADKAGDGLIYKISTEDSGTKLLGHSSLLLNILQSKDENYIITTDRDEKIRVTCYPNTYAIQTYCLGHKEFVNHIELLPHNDKYLVSTSGDGTVKCWNYEKGILCHTIDTNSNVNDKKIPMQFKKYMAEDGIEVHNLPIVHFSITRLNNSCSLIAVCVPFIKKIFIYKLQSSDMEFSNELINTMEVDELPNAIQFHNLFLYVYFPNNISEYTILVDNLQITVDFVKKVDVFKNVDIDFSVIRNYQDGIKVLYKRKHDNMQVYQERKKQRLGIVEGLHCN